jgi:TolB-like protein
MPDTTKTFFMGNSAMVPSFEIVKQQLDLLLEQNEFKRSPVLARFLELVVLTKLASREDEIKEYTIAVKALGKPTDFNPQLDSIVRIHARRLREMLSQYYQKHPNDAVTISIPKGTYVPVFDMNGIVQGNSDPEVNNNDHRRLPSFHKSKSFKPVLAVLPFHDLSSVPSHSDFLTSFGEQLSNELAKYDNLSVLYFYATRNLESDVRDLRELKNEGIDYILTGSLRVFNGSMRLNIQLMMVQSGNILWSDSVSRQELTSDNSFQIQDEIISQIANAIADDPKMLTRLNKNKHHEHLREKLIESAVSQYLEYSFDYDSAKFESTLRHLENAYEVAGDDVTIVSMLSKLYLDQYASVIEHDKSLLQKGMTLAQKAIELDPYSALAQKTLAWAFILGGNKTRGEEAIEQCISTNPYAASNLSTLGLGMIMLGEYESGYSMLKQALRFQQTPMACAKLGFILYYYNSKNYSESNKWLTLLPPFETPFSCLMHIAIEGNLNGKIVPPAPLPGMKGNENDIVSRIVLDPQLQKRIMHGWKLAGFSPADC